MAALRLFLARSGLILVGAFASLCALSPSVHAEGSGISWYSRLPNCLSSKGCKEPLVLYKNSENDIIQSFNLTFRAQYQGGLVDSSEGSYPGSHRSTSEWRRLRIGWNARLFHSFRLVNIWNIGGVDSMGAYSGGVWHDHRQAIGNLYDIHLESEFKGGKISIGKMLPIMMMEYRLSSSLYTLPELPAIEEQLRSDNCYGASVTGMDSSKDWGYHFGVWSDTERGYRKSWGTWRSAFMTTGVSKNVSGFLMEKARLHLDWVYNFADMGDRVSVPAGEAYCGTKARHVVALYYKGDSGPVSLNMEAIGGFHLAAYKANGALKEPSHVIGLVIMPGYMITPNVQVVLRGQWTKGNNGVLLAKRYITGIVPTQGSYVDEYKAIAIGFNFFLFAENQHRMKIMTMAEYGNSERRSGADGFAGWSLIGGVYLDF